MKSLGKAQLERKGRKSFGISPDNLELNMLNSTKSKKLTSLERCLKLKIMQVKRSENSHTFMVQPSTAGSLKMTLINSEKCWELTHLGD